MTIAAGIELKHGKFYEAGRGQALSKEHVMDALSSLEAENKNLKSDNRMWVETLECWRNTYDPPRNSDGTPGRLRHWRCHGGNISGIPCLTMVNDATHPLGNIPGVYTCCAKCAPEHHGENAGVHVDGVFVRRSDRIATLETAIRWALGEDPDGTPDFDDEHSEYWLRDGQGIRVLGFWWRTTLRKLAGMAGEETS